MPTETMTKVAKQPPIIEADRSKEKLKALLKKQFQLDSPDIDFGIYRIINFRRKAIEDFIDRDLIEAVDKEFQKYRTQTMSELSEKVEVKKKEIQGLEKQFEETILRNGDIEEKFRDKPFAKEYLELKKQLDDVEVTESIENQVFNDLLTFFSRYYEDGDFIAKRRYSSRQYRYAIPYNGDEVRLHWANFNEYYVKTADIFKDYEFVANSWRVIFRTGIAEASATATRAEQRYFALRAQNPIEVKPEEKTCIITFEYTRLTDDEIRHLLSKKKTEEVRGIRQDSLNAVMLDRIPSEVKDGGLKSALSATVNGKTVLAKHLYRYTRKVEGDFFIHKDLKSFLEQELDYFLKSEVVDLGNLEPRHVARASVVKAIGSRVIEFLAQIEDFQKKLWEKKKFVVKTNYVITTDLIPKELYEEILSNQAQLSEWKELGFGKPKKDDLSGKHLPVDTKHFPDGFRERLLERLSESRSLDDLIDGILIRSENFQALQLLLAKYNGEVKCVYIDPPYNTGSDEFLYKDKYRHSSWLSMMADRLALAHDLMHKNGAIFITIDDNEAKNLRALMDGIFGEENFLAQTVWQKVYSPRMDAKGYSQDHDYIPTYRRSETFTVERLAFEQNIKQFPIDKATGKRRRLRSLRKEGKNSRRIDRPNLFYPLTAPDGSKVLPIRPDGTEGCWRWSLDKYETAKKKGLIEWTKTENGWQVYVKQFYEEEATKPPSTIWLHTEVGHNHEAVEEVKALFGESVFTNPKPTRLIRRMMEIATTPESDDIVMDFFAGSGSTGHAVMKYNAEDGGSRSYILVEMGDYFGTVLLPRIKKAAFCLGWKNGKPENGEGVAHFVKYQQLEQYEDTIHNVEFPRADAGQKALDIFAKEPSEYLMKYFLQYETEGSQSLLNMKSFEDPEAYKLRIISYAKGEEIFNVDLVETFNYLLGLRVNAYRFLNANDRKYTFVLGEREGRKIGVVWRRTAKLDLRKDSEVIHKAIDDYQPDETYVNGEAYLEGCKAIEPEFKALMGA